MPIDVDATYRRYGPMVLRRCRTLLRDEHEAVDAMHDTFVQLLRHNQTLTDRGLSSLLFRIATNLCLDRLRAARRRPESPDQDLVHRIASLEEPESRMFARLGLSRLLSGQRTSTRTMALLHLHDGLTLQEVAAVVGLSVSGVRKRLRGLKQQLAQQGGY